MALRAWALIGLLALAFMSAGALVQPAPVRSENAADAFDAPAAYARLERLLTPEEPHPMDSDASDGMRARVLAEIEALGVQPEVSDHFTCVPHPEAPIAMGGVPAAGDAGFMGPGFAQAPKRAATDKAARVRRMVMVNS